MTSALERPVVVDLSSHSSGLYCAILQADHGVDVIKIERPSSGDEARACHPSPAARAHPS
jgi:crotonobetainyl-CoA:carnitine CoA-transferase CaiB-like acyl-CoA transferase